MRRTRKCFANKPFSPCGWPIVCFIEIRDRAVNGYSQSCDVSKSQGRTDIYANGETFLSAQLAIQSCYYDSFCQA